jgi:propionyl-CoA carboxylase beta chain
MGKRMDEAIRRLRETHLKNLQGGGEKYIERQHSRGKLTARERIECLVDPGTFSELGSCVDTTGTRIDGRKSEAPCDGAIIGTAKVEGRTVAVYASDFTVLGGSIGSQHLQKCAKLLVLAAQWGIPMVWLLDSSGGRLGYRDVPTAGIDWYFGLESRFSGVIPQINVLMGPCIAGQAYAPTLCDFLLMSRGTSNLWLGGPRMVQAVTSEKIGEDVGGADYHMIYSGTCDLVGNDDRHTISLARKLLSYLPSNFREDPPYRATSDEPEREVPKLMELVPDDPEISYDMHEVIKEVVDEGDFLEIKPEYAKNLICCFARLNGRPVGIVANNPLEPGSIMEVDSCDKYYRFLQVLDAYNIPLVNLVDIAAHVPGEEEEKRGLLRHIGKILDVYATATIPKVTVVLRDCYFDAGGIIMGAVKGMGSDLCYAWPIARFAVEASRLDYRHVYGKGIEEDAYEGYLNRSREVVEAFDAARSWTAQVVDEVIEPKDTRRKIIEALEITKAKHPKPPSRAKGHGTAPT